MPPSIPSSSASAAWRPTDRVAGRFALRASPLLVASLLLLGCAAGFAVLGSEMPRLAAWPLALAAVGYGAWLALEEARRPARDLVVTNGGSAQVDGRPVEGLSVCWRGAIAFVRWREQGGRPRRHVFLPDTLPAPRRRELRLAASAAGPARQAASMAP